MKNIMVIDGAINCAYDIFVAAEEEFALLFPEPEQDVQFVEDVFDRPGVPETLQRLWTRPIHKQHANGIHGTLFVGLVDAKEFYPNKRDSDLDFRGRAHSVAALLGKGRT